MKKILVGALCSTILLGTALPATNVFAATGEEQEVNFVYPEEQTVPITIYADEDTLIIADVPKSYEEEYLKKLENEEFRQNEIDKNISTNKNDDLFTTRAATTTKYMKKREILQVVDSIDNSRNWSSYYSNPLSDVALGAAVKAITKSNFITALVGATVWAAIDIQSRQEAWWKESAIMILRGQITGVKLQIKENTASEYPKVFRTLTRY